MTSGETGAGAAGRDTGERLAAAVADVEQAAHLGRQLDEARRASAACEQAVAQARAALAEEDRDVARLESFSWPSVLAHVRGTHGDDVRREEGERADAIARLGQAETRHSQASAVVDDLRRRRDGLGEVERLLAEARTAHQEWLSDHDPARGPRLVEIAEEDGRSVAEERELTEAIAAGEQAEALLAESVTLLGKASDWAAWDTWGGGGWFTDSMKYDRMEGAGSALQRAGAAVQRLDAELADVHLEAIGAITFDGWDRTFDVWFDNIFTDHRVGKRIGEAGEHARTALGRVRETLGVLRERHTALVARRDALARERVALLGG